MVCASGIPCSAAFSYHARRRINIAGDAVAAEQHDREVVLRDALALLGRPAVPCRSFSQIRVERRHGAMHDAELELGTGMPASAARRNHAAAATASRGPTRRPGYLSNKPLRGDDPGFGRRAIAADRLGLVRPGAAVVGVVMTQLQQRRPVPAVGRGDGAALPPWRRPRSTAVSTAMPQDGALPEASRLRHRRIRRRPQPGRRPPDDPAQRRLRPGKAGQAWSVPSPCPARRLGRTTMPPGPGRARPRCRSGKTPAMLNCAAR